VAARQEGTLPWTAARHGARSPRVPLGSRTPWKPRLSPWLVRVSESSRGWRLTEDLLLAGPLCARGTPEVGDAGGGGGCCCAGNEIGENRRKEKKPRCTNGRKEMTTKLYPLNGRGPHGRDDSGQDAWPT
jgi:hypothetical protein